MELRNKSATFEYFIEDKFDAGMVLTGTEVKAIRDGRVSFSDSYCLIDRGELYVKGLHISHYEYGSYSNHPPVRDRKLLLKKRKFHALHKSSKTKGLPSSRLKFISMKGDLPKCKLGWQRAKNCTTNGNLSNNVSLSGRSKDTWVKNSTNPGNSFVNWH